MALYTSHSTAAHLGADFVRTEPSAWGEGQTVAWISGLYGRDGSADGIGSERGRSGYQGRRLPRTGQVLLDCSRNNTLRDSPSQKAKAECFSKSECRSGHESRRFAEQPPDQSAVTAQSLPAAAAASTKPLAYWEAIGLAVIGGAVVPDQEHAPLREPRGRVTVPPCMRCAAASVYLRFKAWAGRAAQVTRRASGDPQ